MVNTKDRVKYAMQHRRVENARGKPMKCSVCGTTKRNVTYQWANMTGHLDNVRDYKRMCKACHAKHDKIVRNIY